MAATIQFEYSEERELLIELRDRLEARTSFPKFIAYMTRDDKKFIPLSKFQYALCDVLEDVYHNKIPRAQVNLPFAHGKSQVATKLFPAFCLGQDPDLRVVTVSHKLDFANECSRDVREYVRSEAYQRLFPEVQLDPDAEAAGRWRVRGRRGFYIAAGILSGIQGRRADLIISDDLIGSQEDAMSEIIREKIWKAFAVDVASRLEPDGRMLLVASRLHIDDPSGRIIELNKTGAEKWKIFSFPAIATEDDEIGRKPGDALWPERFPIDKLLEIKNSGRLSERDWSATYQQHPIPAGGSIIKREHWRIWSDTKAPSIDYRIMSVDCAFKPKTENDYSAITIWGLFRPPTTPLSWSEKVRLIRGVKYYKGVEKDLGFEFGVGPTLIKRIRDGEIVQQPHFDTFDLDGPLPSSKQQNPRNILLLDAWHGKLPFYDMRRKVLDMHDYWQPNQTVIEDKAAGQTLLQEFARMGVPAYPFNPGKEKKEFRAHMISPIFEQRLVYAIGKKLPDGTRSHTEFTKSAEMVVSECEVFPSGIHDDLVDTVVQSLHYVRTINGFTYEDDIDDDAPKHPQKVKVARA